MARKAFYKRALSQRAAGRCEAAIRKVCICRCGGVLHGAAHEKYMEKEKQLFEANSVIRSEEVDRLVAEASAPVVQ